ncbi:cytochrome bc1 complex cytochrome b subunit [Pseudofrankia inefficax]|uniref:Cytochrome bc1 complex cytochrome b subunit n=1 Tax=Pseudofrankia inefficax (strain DSM 45817 / CECT 9037 / DDB 130130 / EuI1c) TaxID=298654 RepID=E3JBI3_PSEI1|nr:ubiquinol-cytochrome c reductase cytochrome b subunit [Pseudofrankia inefficax]ADP79855.1 ubiquinol-cytochrome c reductase cytochrome b subunit [Pseudofrankia inefficax]
MTTTDGRIGPSAPAPKFEKRPSPVRKANRAVDERFHTQRALRENLNKVFPDHWSFMIGEIALYSFIILLLTGIYLTLFFDPSNTEVIYHGSYVPLKGVEMSRAYASTLDISFDTRAGLIFRQIHHWAALLFVASIIVHCFRVFFTGAYRKPREINWLIGVGLLVLGTLEGFAGYSLPDDLLSGTGLRIAASIAQSIPVIGTWASFLVFNGEWPGTDLLPRLYVVHILLVPGLLLALIGAHLGILWFQKHTDFPGPGKTEDNVVGHRVFPVFAVKSGAFFMMVFAMLALLGGLAQINPIWIFGPYDPSKVSSASQPDFYIGFLDGSTRLMPPWEFRGLGHTIPAVFWPTVILPGILFTLLALWPWLESMFTGDRESHNLLQRPRDAPTRTGIGMMSISFYLVLLISGGNDVIAKTFSISLNAMTWAGRIGLIIVPPITYVATKKLCIGLQKRDHDIAHHGIETGIIRQLPTGEFVEDHRPKLPPVSDYPQVPTHRYELSAPGDHSDGNGNGKGGGLATRARKAVTGFFVEETPGEESADDAPVGGSHH